MRFEQVSVAGVAHVDAPIRVSSSDIEAKIAGTMKRIGMPEGALEMLTGIAARRMWPVGTAASDGALLAAEAVLAQTKVPRDKIGILINTSVCRDYVEPSTACIVHGRLGLPASCLNFDVSNACLGFLTGMELVGTMIDRGQIEYGLIVDGETSRFAVESTLDRLSQLEADSDAYRKNFATLTLGSGAAAMVLGHTDLVTSGHRYVGSVSQAATQHHGLCRGQVDRMETDTSGLLEAGVALAKQTVGYAQKDLGWTPDALDELVLHQVSRTHTEQLAETLGLDLKKVLRTYPEFGNVGPAAVPITLSKANEAGRLSAGDRVALMGIGSGLNCTMAEILW